MAKISSLIKQLTSDSASYSHLINLHFTDEGLFAWNGRTTTLSYDSNHPDVSLLLLHEYGHAILNHQQYRQDIELLTMERDAWDQAQRHAQKYGLAVSDDTIQGSLDTYRDWLHSRSVCPNCESTGIQTSKDAYECLACHHSWRVNEARTCALRRYDTKKRP